MTDELKSKITDSIGRLKSFAPQEGYHLAFSGGKDSCVIKALADMAGVKYRAVYRVTGIDPPELVYFIRKHHSNVEFEYPRYSDGRRVTMWNLIVKSKLPPTRIARYCCRYLKESAGDGHKTITGVRWAESVNRKANQGIVTVYASKKSNLLQGEDFRKTDRGGFVLVNDNDESRRMVEQCYKRHKTTINPIIDWTDDDVWSFIREYKIPYCCLYDEGFERLGCIGCPMAGRKIRERAFLRWPKYKRLYLQAFSKMLAELNKSDRKPRWNSAQEVFNWWMEYDVLPGQSSLFEEVDE